MEKISGILPSSNRVTNVDMQQGGAVRPGAPTFGRPEGVSNLRLNNLKRTTAEKAVEVHKELMDMRSKDREHTEIARRVSNRFFETQAPLPKDPAFTSGTFNEIRTAQQALSTEPISEFGQQVLKENESQVQEPDLDAPEVGYYLDVVA